MEFSGAASWRASEGASGQTGEVTPWGYIGLQEAPGGACDDHELAQPVGGLARECATNSANECCDASGAFNCVTVVRLEAGGAFRRRSPQRVQHCFFRMPCTGVGASSPASTLHVALSNAATIVPFFPAPDCRPTETSPWNTKRITRLKASARANSGRRPSPLSLRPVMVIHLARFCSAATTARFRRSANSVGDASRNEEVDATSLAKVTCGGGK